VRHEVAVPQRAARRAVQREEVRPHPVRLRQRRGRAHDHGGRDRHQQRPRESGAAELPRAPEEHHARRAHRQRAHAVPRVLRQRGGEGGEDQEAAQQQVHPAELRAPGGAQAQHAAQERRQVQRQLLGDEEAVELEGLVLRRGQDDHHAGGLQDAQRQPLGGARVHGVAQLVGGDEVAEGCGSGRGRSHRAAVPGACLGNAGA
jgi:hypothetical protein